ncbi:MAG TPA: zf-HC2 domain-containing protein, partial [Vicinamibacteria bacterium]
MIAGGHERERLSAYLDGELPAAEAAGVAAHVASCAECATLLADMAAVDERFADTPVEAPEGYFDTYASRVRARIEAEPRRAPRRVPAWAWAVAAV